jgi:hypothetical protein
MRFLADESCDFILVRALRAAGHDVIAVSEITPRAKDHEVIDLALREKRILLTEGKDFWPIGLCPWPRNPRGDFSEIPNFGPGTDCRGCLYTGKKTG